MASIIYLSSICRLCLNTDAKEKQTGMFEITESILSKFEAVAQQELILSDEYPRNVCGECCDNLENFSFYKNLLLKKQAQLVEFLKCKSVLKTNVSDDNSKKNKAVEFIKLNTKVEKFIDESGDVGDTFEIKQEVKHPVEIKKEFNTPEPKVIEMLESILDDSIEIDDEFDMPEMEFADYAEDIAGHRPHIILHPSYLKKLEENKNAQSSNVATNRSPIKKRDSTSIQESYPFKCSKCEIIYANQEELDHHMIDHLFEEGPQKCKECSTTFKTATHYKRHIMKDHKGQKYICSVCGNLYLSQPKLTCHLRTHDLTKKFACSFKDCPKAFRLKLHLQNHERTHTGERPFVCKEPGCNSSFKQSYMLTLHRRKHEVHFPFSCKECSMKFTAPESLKNHEENYHTETRPYKCTQCLSSFKRPEHLKIHIAYRHSKNRPFKCDLCDYAAPFRWDLADHFKTSHSSDRPHQCKFCDYKAKKINYLRYHMKMIHESVQVYTCEQCEETFEYCDQLNEHRKNHTIFDQLY
ncbi:unnamed protein product [Diamesa serratosioi]